jgi:hypothetical protein
MPTPCPRTVDDLGEGGGEDQIQGDNSPGAMDAKDMMVVSLT